jgi:signal transduction histidine kinase
VLHDLGLPLALRWLGDRMKQYGLTVMVQLDEQEKLSLSEDHALLLFQSVRERLMNVSNHAQSGEAWVRLATLEGVLTIEVMDKGIGFDGAAVRDSAFGLFSIRERMKALGGIFAPTSLPGMGTSATLKLPLAEKMNHPQ